MNTYDVTVIGAGPGGLAAAIAAHKSGAKVLLIEREARTGGILKQCIHDGFGLIRFGEKLSGPEYAERYSDEAESLNVETKLLTFVTKINREQNGFTIKFVNTDGVGSVFTKTIVLATGCRERTAKQVSIHGTRPSGVFTAGTAQAMMNLNGQRVANRCVILGSGDIGLIMARRLTLEGSKVLGVYEVKSTPSGLTRNIHQCLHDFDIPLYLSRTVTRCFGDDRLTGVEVADVDEKMNIIPGTEEKIDCDTLILSVGLIPENELAEQLGVEINPRTKGPITDERLMTSVPGVFSCGNALHVNDLVDYVSESGVTAGENAAAYTFKPNETVSLNPGDGIAYVVPSLVTKGCNEKITVYFRSRDVLKNATVSVKSGDREVFSKKYMVVRPPEMEKITLDLSEFPANRDLEISLTGVKE